ncbi:HTH_Tnp_Tc3_2 domain-containing protein [Trichonephila clavipes]|nr:HTH_Tnp_Tc3_2 domain-containing protein [Trichonephila clavipes]
MTVKPAVDDMVLGIHTLSKKKVVGDCLAWRSQTVAQLTAQYSAGPSRIVSEHTVGYAATRVPLLTKPHRQLRLAGNIATGPWISGRELPGQMNHGLSFITPMAVSGYAVI